MARHVIDVAREALSLSQTAVDAARHAHRVFPVAFPPGYIQVHSDTAQKGPQYDVEKGVEDGLRGN